MQLALDRTQINALLVWGQVIGLQHQLQMYVLVYLDSMRTMWLFALLATFLVVPVQALILISAQLVRAHQIVFQLQMAVINVLAPITSMKIM